VNLYESSVLSTRLAGVDIKLKQTTAFPLDGTVTMTIEPERPASFDLFLRVPKWCQSAQAFVNGKPLAGDSPAPGTFLKISRPWERADTVTWVLDMPTRAVPRDFARHAGTPVVTFERGPLLLAMTAKLNPGLDLKKTSPCIETDNTLKVETMGALKPASTSSISFRANGLTTVTQLGKDTPKPTPIFLVPYAYSGVSDKPVPPPKEGVFNVYSEDGVGSQVRVEFPRNPEVVGRVW